MKIRTVGQLQDVIDEEYAWRLKEIHELRDAARASSAAQKTFIRAGVALLYAHWEGFIKATAEAYVNYLSYRGLKYSELQSCFVAMGLKGHLNKMSSSGQSAVSVAAVDFMRLELERPASLPTKNSIDTQSNLSSAVFQNIAGWIGVDSRRYSTKFNLVDESLLKRRNHIAHGRYVELDAGTFSDLVDQVLELLRWFKTDLENAFSTQAFLRPQPRQAPAP